MSCGGVCKSCTGFLIKYGFTFGAGVYTGVYIAQNHNIDKVEDPVKLLEKSVEFIKSKFKPPPN